MTIGCCVLLRVCVSGLNGYVWNFFVRVPHEHCHAHVRHTTTDCYVPQIRRLFLNADGKTYQKTNSEGLYEVCLYIDGVPSRVTIDDYVPTQPGGGPVNMFSQRYIFAKDCLL